jgi:hypothetical protein
MDGWKEGRMDGWRMVGWMDGKLREMMVWELWSVMALAMKPSWNCWEGLGVGGTTTIWNSTHGGRGVKVMLGALVYFLIDLGACGKTL